MNFAKALVAGATLLASVSLASAQLFVADPARLLASYHVESVMTWDPVWTWNGQPTTDSNRPTDWQMRLAVDLIFYSDTATPGRLFLEVANVTTLQGVWTIGATYEASVLTGFRFSGLTTPGNLASTFYRAGESELSSDANCPYSQPTKTPRVATKVGVNRRTLSLIGNRVIEGEKPGSEIAGRRGYLPDQRSEHQKEAKAGAHRTQGFEHLEALDSSVRFC